MQEQQHFWHNLVLQAILSILYHDDTPVLSQCARGSQCAWAESWWPHWAGERSVTGSDWGGAHHTTESQTRAQSSDGARPTQPTHGHLSVTIWGELDHVNRPWQLSYTQRYLDDDDDDVDKAEFIITRRKSTADATARIKRWVFNKIKIFKC